MDVRNGQEISPKSKQSWKMNPNYYPGLLILDPYFLVDTINRIINNPVHVVTLVPVTSPEQGFCVLAMATLLWTEKWPGEHLEPKVPRRQSDHVGGLTLKCTTWSRCRSVTFPHYFLRSLELSIFITYFHFPSKWQCNLVSSNDLAVKNNSQARLGFQPWQHASHFMTLPFTDLNGNGTGSPIWLYLQAWLSQKHRFFI